MMHRREFEAIARAVNKTLQSYPFGSDCEGYEALRDVAEEIADELDKVNGRFRKDVFIEACGFKPPRRDYGLQKTAPF